MLRSVVIAGSVLIVFICLSYMALKLVVVEKKETIPMMRNILQLDQSSQVLRQKAGLLTKEQILSAEIQALIQEMKQIMRDAPGVGLAAPQIGVSLQLAVIEDTIERVQGILPEVLEERGRRPVAFHVIINPTIKYLGGRTNYFFEGCLSVKGHMRVTPRKETIEIEYLDENAEKRTLRASGWHARILQHEIDHLHGLLYVDRADARTDHLSNDEFRAKWLNARAEQIRGFYMEKCADVSEDQAGSCVVRYSPN